MSKEFFENQSSSSSSSSQSVSSKERYDKASKQCIKYVNKHIRSSYTRLDFNKLSVDKMNKLIADIEKTRLSVLVDAAMNQPNLYFTGISSNGALNYFFNCIKKSKLTKQGNCDESVHLGLWYFAKYTDLSAEMFYIHNGAHCFIVLGRPVNANPSKPETWQGAWICDPHYGLSIPATEYSKLKNYYTVDNGYCVVLRPMNPQRQRLACFSPEITTMSLSKDQSESIIRMSHHFVIRVHALNVLARIVLTKICNLKFREEHLSRLLIFVHGTNDPQTVISTSLSAYIRKKGEKGNLTDINVYKNLRENLLEFLSREYHYLLKLLCEMSVFYDKQDNGRQLINLFESQSRKVWKIVAESLRILQHRDTRVALSSVVNQQMQRDKALSDNTLKKAIGEVITKGSDLDTKGLSFPTDNSNHSKQHGLK